MADYKILCPACAAMLSSKKPVSNGKKITCPNCHKPFVAATSAANSSDSGSLEFELSPVGRASSSSGKTKKAMMDSSQGSATGSGMAIAGMVLGIVGFLMVLVPLVGWIIALVLGVIGVILSGIGLATASKRGAAKGMAVTGLILSTLAIILVPVWVFVIWSALSVHFAMNAPDRQAVQSKASKKPTDAKPTQVSQNKTKTAAPINSRDEKANKGARPAAAKLDPKSEDGANLATAADVKPKIVVAPAKAIKRTADWKEFKSATGGFAVQFPSPPDETKERDEDIIFYETKSGLNDINYEITFHRLKKDELTVPIKDRFNSFAEQYKATTKEKKEITLSGQPALELMLVDDKTRAFERWIVYKEHVFHIAVSGNKDTLGPDQVTRFLDSFQFVADPQGRFLDITESTTIPEKKK
jgi:hypothetical protein